MEVWWIGSSAKPPMMMVAIALTFTIVFLLNRTEGFRKHKRNSRPLEAVIDTIKAMAIGLASSAFLLLLLRELTSETPTREVLGKIIFESVPFSLGVALANQSNQFLGDTRNASSEGRISDEEKQKESDELHATLGDIGVTLIGATVIAFNIAPTDEIPMLAAGVSQPWLLGIIAISLLITYCIVFEAGFSDQKKRKQQKGVFQQPASETIMCYLVSLLAAAFMLCFFQKLTFDDPWTMWLHYSLLLALPASIGGAAGRLAV